MNMKFVNKIGRMLCHPKTYCQTAVRQLELHPAVLRLYQTVVLPLIAKSISSKPKINVVFLALNVDMWRYDGVYKLLSADNRFNPLIVTATRSNASFDVRMKEEAMMLAYFGSRHYKIIRGYDPERSVFLDVKDLKPDIIFHAQPYDGCCKEIYKWQRFLSVLNCYASYAFQYGDVQTSWNNPVQNISWRHYLCSDHYLEMCRRGSSIKAYNVVVPGYCLEEEYAEIARDTVKCHAAWRNDSRKRIIWAPHHSIDGVGTLRYSSFLLIFDYMLQLRDKYASKVIFAFKPHPMLKQKLYKMWGKEKTDDYYAQWDSANSIYAPGDYKALFAGSDAMIHCSSSFCMEYLYANKPVQYVYRPDWSAPDLGEIGDESFKAHYAAHTKDDIEHFISDVVLNGKDTMGDVRKNYVAKYLRAPNGKTFSQNVYDDIVKGLWG